MGIGDLLTRRGSDSTDDGIERWAVRYQPPGDGAGWRSIERWEDLDEPIDRETFEWNEPNPDPGVYRLFAIENGKLRQPHPDHRWSKTIERTPDEDEERLAERLEQLETAITTQAHEDSRDRPVEIETMEEAIKWEIITDEQLLQQHGHTLIESVLATPRTSSEIPYEDFVENPMGALAFEGYSNPEKLERGMATIGRALAGAVEGFVQATQQPTPRVHQVIGNEDRGDAGGF